MNTARGQRMSRQATEESQRSGPSRQDESGPAFSTITLEVDGPVRPRPEVAKLLKLLGRRAGMTVRSVRWTP